MYSEFVGLTSDVTTLIERLRKSPDESKSDILKRVLTPLVPAPKTNPTSLANFELGQGVMLTEGETLLLFLTKSAKQAMKPDGSAEIRKDGFYMNGKKINSSPKRALNRAMKMIQEKMGHKNDRGEIISHSSWRDWHVLRDGRLFSLDELKNPALAHRRGMHKRQSLTLEDLGL